MFPPASCAPSSILSYRTYSRVLFAAVSLCIQPFVLNAANFEEPYISSKDFNANASLAEVQYPIDAQLDALLKGNIPQAYYLLVNTDFQKNISYTAFENFIHDHPIFSKQSARDVLDYTIDSDEASVVMRLRTSEEQLILDYRLCLHKQRWLIDNIKISVALPSQWKSRPATIQHLGRIFEELSAPWRLNQIPVAYFQSTTKGFQEKNTLEEFRCFLQKYPAITQGTVSYFQGQSHGSQALLKAHFKNSTQSLTLFIVMRREQDSWKIDSLEITQETPSIAVVKSPFLAFDDDIAVLLGPKPTPLSLIKDPETRAEASNAAEANALTVVEQLLQALHNGRLAEAYTAFMSRGFQKVNDFKAFQTFATNYSIFTGATNSRLKIQKQTSEGYINVGAELEETDQTATINFLLVDEGMGTWKILAIDIHTTKQVRNLASLPPDPTTGILSTTPLVVSRGTNEEEGHAILFAAQQLLASLRHADFSAAYRYYMTPEFQKTTPYEEFKKTLQRLPILTQGQPNFKAPQIVNNNQGSLVSDITSPYGQAILNFTLLRATDGWKIHSLEISGSSAPSAIESGEAEVRPLQPVPPDQLDATQPEYPIQAQIYRITHDEAERSYFDLTAQEFQRSSSLQDYKKFIENYDVFAHNAGYAITADNVKDDLATYKVNLTSDSGEKATIVYDLTRNQGAWKILNMEVASAEAPPKGLSSKQPTYIPLSASPTVQGTKGSSSSSPTALIRLAPRFSENSTLNNEALPLSISSQPSSIHLGAPTPSVPALSSSEDGGISLINPVNFTYGAFGTSINKEGMVQNPSLRIIKDQKKESIYFNLYVENGKRGLPITLNFQHLKSGVFIPQINSQLKSDGSNILSYIFSPPPEGWPEGTYQVQVSATDGSIKTFNFSVQ